MTNNNSVSVAVFTPQHILQYNGRECYLILFYSGHKRWGNTVTTCLNICYKEANIVKTRSENDNNPNPFSLNSATVTKLFKAFSNTSNSYK